MSILNTALVTARCAPEVDSFINVGEDVLFDMDWEGARQNERKSRR